MMNEIVQYPDPSLNVPVEPLHIDEFEEISGKLDLPR